MEQNATPEFKDKEMTLGTVRGYILEWYPDGIIENISKLDGHFEDYDRELVIKDAKYGDEIFRAIFQWGLKIDDKSKVYLSGFANEEFRGIIAKTIELDEQIAKASAQSQQNQNPQKGE